MLIYTCPLPSDSTACPLPSDSTACPLPSGSTTCPLQWRGVGGWAAAESPQTKYSLLLGGFDGLHLGHRALLSEAKKGDFPILLTTMFGGKGNILFTREERRVIFAKAGVDALCEIDLDETLRATSADEFIEALFSRFNVGAVYCGEDFRFGRDAAGTPALLKRLAPCPVHVLHTVGDLSEEHGTAHKFSASACKDFLRSGNLPRLNTCLYSAAEDFYGGAYFVQGVVEHGRAVGRTYGFPTLNLSVPAEKLLPPDGVYGGLCATPQGNFPTIVNIGARPTFGVGERKIEAYLDGFSGDLYGSTVQVYPTEFFRPIQKFSGADALQAQLQKDIARLREKYR